MKSIRNAANNIFVKVILALLSLTFISWGATSAFVGNVQNEVITINGEPVFLSEVHQEHQQRLGQIRRSINGEVTPEIEEALGVREAVVRSIITEKVLEQEAKRLNLRAAPKQMQDIILANPNFLDVSGNFSRDIYTDNLGRAGLTVNAYENLLRRQILFADLSNIFTSHMADSGVLSNFANYARTTANVQTLELNVSSLKKQPKPTAEEIKKFYDENVANLTTEEKRDFAFINISAKDMLGALTLNAEDVKAEYENNLQDYMTGERRHVRHILTNSEESANVVVERLNKGEEFSALAKELSQDFLSKNKGGELGTLELEDMISGTGESTFALAVNTVSAPMKSDLGYHVVEVLSVQSPRQLSFDEVKQQIEEDMKLTQAEDAYYDMLDKVEDGIDSGASLAEIAKNVGLKASVYTNVAFNDDEIASLTDIRNSAFTLNEGEISTAIEVDGAEAVSFVQTTKVEQSRPQTLEEASDVIVTRLSEIKTETALQEKATKLIEEVQNGDSLAKVARRHGLKLTKVNGISREGENAPAWLQRFHLTNIFKLKAGETLAYPVTTGEGFALISLKKFDKQPWSNEQTVAFFDSTRSAMGRDLLEQFAGHLRQQANVEIKQTVIDNLLNGVYTEGAAY